MNTSELIEHKRRMHEDQQLLSRECAEVQAILNQTRERKSQMSESGPEKLQRVRNMSIDTSGTWDLSPKDQLALRHVLGMVDYLSGRVSAYAEEETPDDVIGTCHQDLE